MWDIFQADGKIARFRQTSKIVRRNAMAFSRSFLRMGYLIPSGPGVPFFQETSALRMSDSIISELISPSGGFECEVCTTGLRLRFEEIGVENSYLVCSITSL